MERWLKEGRKVRESPKNLLKTKRMIKHFDWGRGTEKTSEEIDEVLYGSK